MPTPYVYVNGTQVTAHSTGTNGTFTYHLPDYTTSSGPYISAELSISCPVCLAFVGYACEIGDVQQETDRRVSWFHQERVYLYETGHAPR